MVRVDDPIRLAALHDSGLLDGHGVPGIDRLLRIAKHALDTPTVMFTAVDIDRQVFVGQIGLPESWANAGQTPLSHSYCQIVVTEDKPLIVTDAIGDDRVCHNPATVEASIGSYLGVPVRSPDGQPIGSFCAMSDTPRTWSNQDIATLSDLAASVEVEVSLRQTTAELSDQLAGERLERSFEASMASVAAATSSSWSSTDLIKALVERGAEAAGAQLISVALLDGERLQYFHGRGVSHEVAKNWLTGNIDDQVPMAHAIKTGEVVVLPTEESFTRWPMFAKSVSDLGIRSLIALPVGDTLAGSQAVVALGWADQLSSLALPRSVVRLGTLVRQGLDRAHSHQTAREHAELLESLVLPDELPTPDHLEITGLYRPPTTGQRVGGDLYEAIQRPDGKVALIVADAAGHDLAASRATSRLRTALNMLTLEELRPAQILDYVNTYLHKSNVSTLITCVYVLVDTEKNSAIVSNAGHPQPRLSGVDSAIVPVGPIGQPLLGLGTCDYGEENIEFNAGDTLTLFTDGLIERRSVPLTEGEAWLERELAMVQGASAETIAYHLIGKMGVLQDDVAVLVARHTGQGSAKARQFDHQVRANELKLAEVRAELRDWLDGHARADDILLVGTELLTNARDSSDPFDSMIDLSASEVDGQVELSVTNRGRSFRLGQTEMPSVETIRGRGLALAASMCDLEVKSEPPLVTVTALFSPS